jgi:regulator of replication initiation timing
VLHKIPPIFACAKLALPLLALCALARLSRAQDPGSPSDAPNQAVLSAVHELEEQVRQLREAVVEIRSEAAEYRAETVALRQELEQARAGLAAGRNLAQPAEPGQAPSPTSTPLPDRVRQLEEDSQLLSAKINEQYQTKVESASKYRVRLSGIVLMNLFSDRGIFDNQDFPSFVPAPYPGHPQGSFGATVRQSEVGLEVFGPHLVGASTRGDLQMDFAGGFPNIPNGVTSGILRLRTATLRLDWKKTSIVAGQDEAFFTPLSPTSFSSLAVPAFNYAGNLWEWVPQVRVEHSVDITANSNLLMQFGILDNLTGDLPASQWGNIPQAGQRIGQPAYATRVAWSRPVFGQPLTLGAAAYYGRQDWWFDRYEDGWAGTADWDIPVSRRWTVSGEFYRGKALGALGGGIGRSTILSGPIIYPRVQVRGLNSLGGWSQLKFRPTAKLEFNAAFGIDNPIAQDVRAVSTGESNSRLPIDLRQNRSSFGNVIYRPHQNLLLSAQYNHLWTSPLDLASRTGGQVNLTMGILF